MQLQCTNYQYLAKQQKEANSDKKFGKRNWGV